MNYNYVFITSNMENMEVLYNDLNSFDNCQLLLVDRKFYSISFLERLLLSKKLPLKNLRVYIYEYLKKIFIKKNYNEMFSGIKAFDNTNQLCFIIYARDFEFFGRHLKTILQKKYPRSRFVCYFGDVCSSFQMKMKTFKKSFDYLFSFNLSDCKTENMIFIHEPFSNYNFDEKIPLDCDVTFVGAAKDRLNKILDVYKSAKQKKLNLDFHIVGVEECDMYDKERISYNKPLKYKEVLKKDLASKCIFEVMQENSLSPTTRYSEAIVYNKYLITNCQYFKNLKNKPKNIIYFENACDIDWNFLDIQPNFDNTEYLEELTINNFIKTIEETLKG